MTTAALKRHPKVYWIWNHRRWCLENVPLGPEKDSIGWRQANWDQELRVVEKMLDADPRNCAIYARFLRTHFYCVKHSSCMELQEICTGKYAYNEIGSH
jgi:hypothetical protein